MRVLINPRLSIALFVTLCTAQVVTDTALADNNNKGIPNQIDYLQKQIDDLKKKGNADEILIMRDDFEYPNIVLTDWNIQHNAGATVEIDHNRDDLTIITVPNDAGGGAGVISGTKAFSVNKNTLIFKTRETVYRDHTLYGDFQPRGLVSGVDRDNAIEFVSSLSNFPQGVACRTVSNGTVTETVVDIGQDVFVPNVYEIVATASKVDFYVNGKNLATHTTNIPSVPLNVYFSSSDGGAGNVPIIVDWVSFARKKAW